MRLIFIPIIILLIFVILAIFTPVLLLQASEPVLPKDIRESSAQVLADISGTLGRYETASELFDYLIVLHPGYGPYYGKKSWYLQQSGRTDEALAAMDGAIGFEPENADYMLRKARMLKGAGKTEEAERTYAELIRMTPQDRAGMVHVGDGALDQGDYLKAYEKYTQAVRIDPSDGKTWEKRGDIIFILLTIPTAGLKADPSFVNVSLYDQGIESYQNAMKINRGDTNEIMTKIGKHSDQYTPRSIADLRSRYKEYRYLG